jgi:TonB family protein
MRPFVFVFALVSVAAAAAARGADAPGTPALSKLPKQVVSVEAAYPPDAAAAGIEADVVLNLTIDETGHVSHAKVATSAGPGREAFDAAAVAAATGYLFEPAESGGKPVPVELAYKVKFRLHAKAPAPAAGAVRPFYRSLGRYASAFALTADAALLTLSAGLKRREMISGRFGDILSELYLLSAVLKRWEEEGRQAADLPLVEWCMQSGFATIETRLDEILANLPMRPVAWLLRIMLLPFGVRRRGPADRLTQVCAGLLLRPSATRDRLTMDIFHGTGSNGLARLERAFELTVATETLRDRLRQANVRDIEKARQQNIINDGEAAALHAAAQAVAGAVAVDDFAPEELSPQRALGDVLSQAMPRPTAAE